MYWLIRAHYEGTLLMVARAVKWFAIGGAAALLLIALGFGTIFYIS